MSLSCLTSTLSVTFLLLESSLPLFSLERLLIFRWKHNSGSSQQIFLRFPFPFLSLYTPPHPLLFVPETNEEPCDPVSGSETVWRVHILQGNKTDPHEKNVHAFDSQHLLHCPESTFLFRLLIETGLWSLTLCTQFKHLEHLCSKIFNSNHHVNKQMEQCARWSHISCNTNFIFIEKLTPKIWRSTFLQNFSIHFWEAVLEASCALLRKKWQKWGVSQYGECVYCSATGNMCLNEGKRQTAAFMEPELTHGQVRICLGLSPSSL